MIFPRKEAGPVLICAVKRSWQNGWQRPSRVGILKRKKAYAIKQRFERCGTSKYDIILVSLAAKQDEKRLLDRADGSCIKHCEL